MLTTVGLAMVSTVLTAFGLFGLWALLTTRNTREPQGANRPAAADEGEVTEYFSTLAARIAAVEITVAGLPGLYQAAVAHAEEETQRAKNFNNRALQAERRVREILEEDEEDLLPEEQVERVQQLDELRGEAEGVLPLQSPLELTEADYERNARAQAHADQYGL